MNARFWVWYRSGWVKFTLRPGESQSTEEGGRHEEGWHREETQYTHEGEGVRCEWQTDGADCDGRHSASGAAFCPLDQLRARDMAEIQDATENAGIHSPEWTTFDHRQRDYAAEATGY